MQEWTWEVKNVIHMTVFQGNQTFPDNTTLAPEVDNKTDANREDLGYHAVQAVLIAITSGLFSFVTTLGNIMVMISFKMDKQLQTISNYYLFSLAVADFIIGIFSMPVYTVNLIAGYWPFSAAVCDTWLAVDYLASNASVMNLLIISFDRYYSVTRPLSYRARRTTKKAAGMITLAWVLSLILWVPWIYAWPYIEGERIPPDECYVQFIQNNIVMSVLCAMAAFFVPVTVMCGLYLRVWWETVKRQRDLVHLQAGKKASSKRSDSSEEYGDIRIKDPGAAVSLMNGRLARPPLIRERVAAVFRRCGGLNRKNSVESGTSEGVRNMRLTEPLHRPQHQQFGKLSTSSGQLNNVVDRNATGQVNSIDRSNGGASGMTNTPSGLRANPRNQAYFPHNQVDVAGGAHGDGAGSAGVGAGSEAKAAEDTVYTILIQLPSSRKDIVDPDSASIKLLSETSLVDLPNPDRRLAHHPMNRLNSTDSSIYSLSSSYRDRTHSMDDRISLDTRIVSKQYVRTIQNPNHSQGNTLPRKNKVKKASQEKKQERKAAKTLSAILFVFIVTWTPYSVLSIMYGILGNEVGDRLIPKVLWDVSYYLCYMNSTINPFCYALCNAAFRRTYMRILTCKWKGSEKPPIYHYG